MEINNAIPINCQLCDKLIKSPVRLICLHYFCRDCVNENKCPLCGTSICTKELFEDRVLNYIVDSLQETIENCANCDKVTQPMYFCETCKQPLCCQCRLATHRAKIFIKHQIVQIEECGRLRTKVICDTHNEPFILYCLQSKSLMCIECFNRSSLEHRYNFVNMDLAHKICCDKLQKYAVKLRNFQEDLNEQIALRKRVLSGLNERYKCLIESFEKKCDDAIAKLSLFKKEMIEKATIDKDVKQKIILEEVKKLNLLQGPINLTIHSYAVYRLSNKHFNNKPKQFLQ